MAANKRGNSYMGLFDILDKVSEAVGAALNKVTPKGFRLADAFKSSISSKIASFAGGVKSEFDSWDIPFPAKIRAKKFMDELKIELRERGIFVTENKNLLEFEKAKLSVNRNKISIEKLAKKVEGKPTVAFIRLKLFEANRILKESYEVLNSSPNKASVAAFQKAYAKHLMAASDGIKAGLNSIGQKPESRTWDKPLETFLGGYSDYLLKKFKKENILPSSEFSLSLGSSAQAKKFKGAFEAEVKSAIGETKPAYVAIKIKGTRNPELIVQTETKKVSQVKFAENETARRVIH